MITFKRWWAIVAAGFVLICVPAGAALADDLISKQCDELIGLAQAYQQDLKTVDTVLGSAIDAGNLERIRSYKLRKGAVAKQLRAVMTAIQARGCLTKE